MFIDLTLNVLFNNNSFLISWNQNNSFIYPIVDYKLEVSENIDKYIEVPGSSYYFISNLKLSKFFANISLIY